MFERIRNLFRPAVVTPTVTTIDHGIKHTPLDLIGDDLDCALHTYSELLDSSCRDSEILNIARERVMDLQARYQVAKLDELEKHF